jgi:hypothetical protein
MVGLSVHGLLGVDAELERSALAARQPPAVESFRVSAPVDDAWDCNQAGPPRVKT